MIRQEALNNTPAQVREYIVSALALVDDLDPPEDLRQHVFVQAVQLYAGKQIMWQQPQSLPPNMVVPRGL